MKFNLSERIQKQFVDRSLTSCTRWAEKRVWMPKPFDGPVSFDRFPWQREVLNIDEGIVTVKKAAQIGFSVAGMIRALYVLSEKQADVLYVLPTYGLALDFSKSRMDALTGLSPYLKDIFKTSNAAGLKITEQRANLYIRGSVADSGLVSVPVGTAIIDEYDRCSDNTYDLVTERLSGQLQKYLFSLSTPTMPEFGIDSQHRLGTQEEFHFKCPSCSKMIRLEFPDNVAIHGEFPGDPKTADSYYFCTKCKAKLPSDPEGKMEMLKHNEWVPKVNVQGHRSFHINQMYSLTVTPEELVNAYHKAELSELAEIEFKNQKLGEPHIGENARLTDTIINECKTGDRIGEDRPTDSSRMICMGIDVGKFLDCWIAEYKYLRNPGNEPYLNSHSHLLQKVRVPEDDWNQLANLMREWQVRYAAIDFQPNTTNARRFCKMFKGHAAMVAYRRGTVGNEIKETKDEHGVPCLTIDRTSFLDMALGRFHQNRISIPANTPGVVTEHLKAPARTYEVDEMGVPRGVYKTSPGADDHFAHAAVYCEVAHFRAFCQSTGRVIKPDESF